MTMRLVSNELDDGSRSDILDGPDALLNQQPHIDGLLCSLEVSSPRAVVNTTGDQFGPLVVARRSVRHASDSAGIELSTRPNLVVARSFHPNSTECARAVRTFLDGEYHLCGVSRAFHVSRSGFHGRAPRRRRSHDRYGLPNRNPRNPIRSGREWLYNGWRRRLADPPHHDKRDKRDGRGRASVQVHAIR
jgi:hypothetical protein